jgi:hypothetical protein
MSKLTKLTVALLFIMMNQASHPIIGRHPFSTDLKVVQRGVLSPILFILYLEEPLRVTLNIREMVSSGAFQAFADDILILNISKQK